MTETIKRRLTRTELFWGRMAHSKLPARVLSLVFVLAAIASMSFSQLGFWPIGVIDGKVVYLLLLLAPLVMGAFIFGPITGALLGLYTGAVVYIHALAFPLDYYEVYYMSALNAFVLPTVVGGASGWLFSVVMRRNPKGVMRFSRIVVACLFLSFAASALMAMNTVLMYGGYESAENFEAIREYLLLSPLGGAVQALIDAVLMIALCWGADVVTRRMQASGENHTLLSLFAFWVILVSAIVFMLVSGAIFAIATYQSKGLAFETMASDIDYIQRQLAQSGDESPEYILDGYNPTLDGYVVITDEQGVVIASDDERLYPKGSHILDLLGYGSTIDGDPKTATKEFFEIDLDTDELNELQASDRNGVQSMEIAFFSGGEYDKGYIGILYTPAKVYTTRLSIMVAMTTLAVLLIAAIVIVAAIVLRHVVVRRISETNDSLDKITHGNLNERVRINDNREFISLSAGINTTVSALKDTIDEVKQRNAQDLATAKTIQESTLPREFPPFPQIDKFDIYASMKTAKEVGGDFYDLFLIGDDNDQLGFVMADVSGKGIPAALFMMTAKTQIRNYMEAGLPLGEAIDAANHQLCLGNDAGMFVTVWVGVLEYETGMLTYVNCGHNPPMLLHEGAWGWVSDVSGMPLGLFDGIPYDAYTRQLTTNDMLYLYTDGVTEAMNTNDELFGEERLERTLEEYATMNPRSVGVGVRRALTDFTRDAEQSDDITMLILKYGVPPEKKAVMVLPADDKQLVHVYNFIHEELHRRNAPSGVRNPLDIAAEELFVNVCHYAYPDATPDNPGQVRISFEYENIPPSLTVEIADDGIPYNPLEKPDAVTPDDIMEVPIGGLGILMAKRSVDEMRYERIDGSNVLTFKKGW